MHPYQETTIHDDRQLSKMSLETFYCSKNNFFDFEIEKLVSVKEENLNRHIENLSILEKYKGVNSKKIDIEAYHQEYMILAESIYYEEKELQTLVEMQIVYAFKMFEIGLKQLLSAAFSLKKSRELYKWENIIYLLEKKGLKIKQVEHYPDINHFRLVNNTIKHSGLVTSEMKNIPEFSNKDYLDYQSLRRFYVRVNDIPIKFSNAVAHQVYQFLYCYDDNKIQKIAKKIALRMEKADAEKLCKELLSLYTK